MGAQAAPLRIKLARRPIFLVRAMAKAMKAMKAKQVSMSAGGLFAGISSKTGSKPKEVKAIFTALQGIAASEVAKSGKFVVPNVVMLKLKHKPARPAGTRVMFGKEVKVAAKKASKVVRALPVSAIKKAI